MPVALRNGIRNASSSITFITIRITVLRQFAQGLENHDEEAGHGMLNALSRIK